ncbi:MAG: BMP family ABC transporter substrate-binding protein [Treponema sp.]|nr:BMP family ABC transporter substrate-binding protein [Treponema sp.]
MKVTHIILVILGIISVILLTSCEKKPDSSISEDGKISMRLLTDATGVDDKSFNAAAWRGVLQYYGDTWDNQANRGKAYDVITAESEDMYIPNLMLATDAGYDLIAVTGFTWENALMQVAKENPSQKYMIVDITGGFSPNVMQAAYSEHEGSYLAGAAAALKAKEDNIANPRFGFIGGMKGAVITKFEIGYVQGILSVLPDAYVEDYYVDSWGDAAKAKTRAKSWYDSGIYAIFSAAGSSGNGTIAQAKEYREAGMNVWAIGVDSDQYEDGLYNDTDSAVLTTMLKLVENSMTYALKSVEDGSFKGEKIIFDLAGGGVGYSAANKDLSENIISELEEIKEKIISGEIIVAATYADAKLLPGFPQHLNAADD